MEQNTATVEVLTLAISRVLSGIVSVLRLIEALKTLPVAIHEPSSWSCSKLVAKAAYVQWTPLLAEGLADWLHGLTQQFIWGSSSR